MYGTGYIGVGNVGHGIYRGGSVVHGIYRSGECRSQGIRGAEFMAWDI